MRLKESTRAPQGLDKDEIKEKTKKLRERLHELQAVLFAESKHAFLIVLQGMDASGKDGSVKGVFNGVNPMGCLVKAYKAPTEIERAHDFLWRIHAHAPAKGMIQIFNRSHYEDILVPRVKKWIDGAEVKRRINHINNWELLLKESGTQILKFYLHISEEEQQQRFEERLTIPEKRWKYKASDLAEAKLWPQYREAFEDIFEHCNLAEPWQIIPADQNWYRDYLIASAVVERMESLNMQYPQTVGE
ncbi:MAG: polyphosphate kinase [Bacteroidetes bacterium]|nr:polyphosphate kinase [Bacteroidota bacterium]